MENIKQEVKEVLKDAVKTPANTPKGETPRPQTTVPQGPKMRQIIIETDGNSIKVVKAEVGGSIELTGILQNLINFINKPKE